MIRNWYGPTNGPTVFSRGRDSQSQKVYGQTCVSRVSSGNHANFRFGRFTILYDARQWYVQPSSKMLRSRQTSIVSSSSRIACYQVYSCTVDDRPAGPLPRGPGRMDEVQWPEAEPSQDWHYVAPAEAPSRKFRLLKCQLWAHPSPSSTQLVSLAWWSTAV